MLILTKTERKSTLKELFFPNKLLVLSFRGYQKTLDVVLQEKRAITNTSAE